LRKYLVAALVAALSLAAVAAVSYAQAGDSAKLTTVLTPKNAGTKRKPTNSKLNLTVVNNNTQRTMSDLDIFLPKTLKLSLKGMPSCSLAKIQVRGCPSSSILGTGTAEAKTGVNGTSPGSITFDVKAVKTTSPTTGKTMLGFIIDDGGSLLFLAETTLGNASGKYGQKLHLDVPPLAQKAGTAYNGLVSLNKIKLGKKKGTHKLLATTGCKNHKQPFKVVLTFIDNGVTTATKYGDTSTWKCTK
jgi:hypothetical protein